VSKKRTSADRQPAAAQRVVLVSDEVREWLSLLVQHDSQSAMLIRAAVRVLSESGPALGRPLVDSVKGSRIKNLKELRPGSSGRSEVRILFAFDPLRQAILLVAGDKSTDWNGWYDSAIRQAERLYDAHLCSINTNQRQ
jgi:hypothetical protein